MVSTAPVSPAMERTTHKEGALVEEEEVEWRVAALAEGICGLLLIKALMLSRVWDFGSERR